mgnify:CR=1 FL=1
MVLVTINGFIAPSRWYLYRNSSPEPQTGTLTGVDGIQQTDPGALPPYAGGLSGVGSSSQVFGSGLHQLGGSSQGFGSGLQQVGGSPQGFESGLQEVDGYTQGFGSSLQNVGGSSQMLGSSFQEEGGSSKIFADGKEDAGGFSQFGGSSSFYPGAASSHPLKSFGSSDFTTSSPVISYSNQQGFGFPGQQQSDLGFGGGFGKFQQTGAGSGFF